jgi:hypothetical protein
MDKYIDIEFQYDKIVLNLEHMALKDHDPVPSNFWDAIERAERRIYRDDPGTHGWTDVNDRFTSPDFIMTLWNHCEGNMSGTIADWDSFSENTQLTMIGRRVALGLALMAFGPEFLLR